MQHVCACACVCMYECLPFNIKLIKEAITCVCMCMCVHVRVLAFEPEADKGSDQ